MSSAFGVGNSAFRTITGKTLLVDTVPFPAFTIEMIKKAGLYDEELVRDQDDEFNYRLREHGGKIVLNPEIRSIYSHAQYSQILMETVLPIRLL